MRKIVFFDLDGPILDVSEKYYRVYSDILSRNGFKVLSKTAYWNAKREKIPDREILEKSFAVPFLETYQFERRRLIESDPYLIYDRLQDGARDVLETLSLKTDLVIVTLRTYAEQLHKQLEHLDLKKYFLAVLSSGEETSPRWKMKYELIENFLATKVEVIQHVLIGDTETDILAGKNLGIKTVAVLNGIRSYRVLKEAEPSYLITSIREILEIGILNSTVQKDFID